MIVTGREYFALFAGRMESVRVESKVKTPLGDPFTYNCRVVSGMLKGELITITRKADLCEDGNEAERVARKQIDRAERRIAYWEDFLSELDEAARREALQERARDEEAEFQQACAEEGAMNLSREGA